MPHVRPHIRKIAGLALVLVLGASLSGCLVMAAGGAAVGVAGAAVGATGAVVGATAHGVGTVVGAATGAGKSRDR